MLVTDKSPSWIGRLKSFFFLFVEAFICFYFYYVCVSSEESVETARMHKLLRVFTTVTTFHYSTKYLSCFPLLTLVLLPRFIFLEDLAVNPCHADTTLLPISILITCSIRAVRAFSNRVSGKQCGSWSDGFARSQQIWIYRVFPPKRITSGQKDKSLQHEPMFGTLMHKSFIYLSHGTCNNRGASARTCDLSMASLQIVHFQTNT